MELAKPCLDVGIYTDRYEHLRAFYVDGLGLPYEELLKVGGGVHQHRVGLHGSVLKLNASREPLESSPSGFVQLDLHSDRSEHLTDPDGLAVVLSPDVARIAIHWASSDPARLGALLQQGFDAEDLGRDRWQIGTTVLALQGGGGAFGPMRSRGLRYLTVQVVDVRAEHERLCSLGWSEGMAPVKLGETALISFVHDPDGAPVEISQRASLTGPLP